MNTNRDELEQKLRAFRRNAWFPTFDDEKPNSPSASRFSGIAFIPENDEWPKCGNCGKEMQLFLQLNSKELPAETGDCFGEGLLQVFYCTNYEDKCEIKCESYFPFSKATNVRIVDPEGIRHIDYAISPVIEPFPEKVITGWNAERDYPNLEELSDLEVELSDEECELLFEMEFPIAGDKLLGWPAWVQGVEYPDCPKCGSKMSLIFQIDSEDNIPYMFGDVGCSHVTQCKIHPEVLAIAWACS